MAELQGDKTQESSQGNSNSAHDTLRCSRCMLPASLPSVRLGPDGVCNHCKTYDAWLAEFRATESERRVEFERLLARAKRLKQPYDVLIPLSGGKDSTYALYLCSKVYHLKCLCVTFDNGYLSEFGKANIEAALKASGADHIVYRIDRDLLLRVYRLFLRKCGNFCAPCNRAIEVTMRMASRAFSVPLIVCGHGAKPHMLSDGLMPELQQGGDVDFVRNVLKGEPLEAEAAVLLSHPSASTRLDRVANAIARILPFSGLRRVFWAFHARFRNLLSWLRIEKHVTPHYVNYQDYLDIAASAMREILESEMGWRAPVDKFDHVDCLIEPVKVYIQTLRFPELSRETVRNSGRVRSGQMKKAEALAVDSGCLGDAWVPGALEALLRDTGMTEEEFQAVVRDWRAMERFRVG